MSGKHPSWTLLFSRAGTHSFVFQHPSTDAPPTPLVPHICATRTTVIFSPGLADDAAPSKCSHTHFDSE